MAAPGTTAGHGQHHQTKTHRSPGTHHWLFPFP
jgi:hypothetical protein